MRRVSLASRAKSRADFEQAIAGWQRDHSEVLVRRHVEHGAQRHALLKAASEAQLLVAGARGRGGLRGRMLG